MSKKAMCIWCECGELDTNKNSLYTKHGLIYLHLDCFNELTDFYSDMGIIKKFMEGKKATEVPGDTISAFLKRMDNFETRWKGTMKLKLSKEET